MTRRGYFSKLRARDPLAAQRRLAVEVFADPESVRQIRRERSQVREALSAAFWLTVIGLGLGFAITLFSALPSR